MCGLPRVSKELSALEPKRFQNPGTRGNANFAVGGVSGLVLQITPNNGRTWQLRVSVGGRRCEIGLGGFPDVSLAQACDWARARARARESNDQIRRGVDPVEERKSARAALIASRRRGLTFKDAVDMCLSAKVDAYNNAKHRDQWRTTLKTYATPFLGTMPVQTNTVPDVLRVVGQTVNAAGRIDATQADSIAMDAFLATDAGKACCAIEGAVADDPPILGAGVGAGIREGEDDLKAKIDAGIAGILEDGTCETITKNNFVSSI